MPDLHSYDKPLAAPDDASSDERLQLALDAAAMGTFVWHPAEGRAFQDERMLALFGLPPGGSLALDTALAALLHPDDRARYSAALARALDPAGPGRLREEIRVPLPSGGERWIAITAKTWFAADDGRRPSHMVGVATDITERKHAEAALRASEARQAFLLQLNDRLRPLVAPEEIQHEAACALGEQLGADRVMYGEVDGPDDGSFLVYQSYQREGMPAIAGRHRFDAFGAYVDGALRAGRTLAVADVRALPEHSAENLAAYAAAAVGAYVAVPLVKAGRIAAYLSVNQRAPRSWTPDELGLVEAVAERTWAAVERSRATAALRESEERLRRTLAIETVGVFFFTLGGRILDANPAFERMSGYSREALRSLPHWRPLIAPDFLAATAHATDELARQGATAPYEKQLLRSDGSRWWALCTPTRLSGSDDDTTCVEFVIDISEQKQAEQAAADAVARTARLHQVTAALSAALTPADVGRVVVEHSLAALGAALGSIRVLSDDGAWLQEVYGYGDMSPALAPWRLIPIEAGFPLTDAVRGGRPVWIESLAEAQARYPGLAPLMQSHGYLASASIPLIINQRVIGALALSFAQPRSFSPDDRAFLEGVARQCAQVLERTRLYEAEQQARAAAEAAVQLRDQFLSVAAHELKTPLTSLLGNAQLLQRRAGRAAARDERELRNIQVIVDQAQRLNRMILALLDVSRLETGQLAIERELIDVGQLLARLIEEARPGLEERPIALVCPDEPLRIEGDSLRLEQVVQNLLQNAVKYSPPGSPIRVAVAQKGGTVRVAISDDGIGIPAAALPRLFQRFFRADNVDVRQVSGMGIGLYVVREIVALHGGTVEVDSVEGQGSTFTVVLPSAPRDAAPRALSAQSVGDKG